MFGKQLVEILVFLCDALRGPRVTTKDREKERWVLMKGLFKYVLAFGFALALTFQARGAFYDFSTMGYTDGQVLEGMVLGVATFTSETSDLQYYSSYGGGIGTAYTWGAAADTYVAFSTPVSGLSIVAL